MRQLNRPVGRLRKIIFVGVVVFFSSLLLSMPAVANVIGTDTQNFNTTTDGLDFVTVQSSKTLEPGIINFGFFLNYAVNTLPYFGAVTMIRF